MIWLPFGMISVLHEMTLGIVNSTPQVTSPNSDILFYSHFHKGQMVFFVFLLMNWLLCEKYVNENENGDNIV